MNNKNIKTRLTNEPLMKAWQEPLGRYFKKFLDGKVMLLLIVCHLVDKLDLKELAAKYLVAYPHHLAHVVVALVLRTPVEVVEGIKAEQIEHKAVGDDVLACHRLTLLERVMLFVKRIVNAHVLVERDANHAVAHHDALVERSNLCIDTGNGKFGNLFQKPLETLLKVFVQVVHVGILRFHVAYKYLKRTVLEIRKKLFVYLRIVDHSDAEHILKQGPRFHRIVGFHLLKCGKVARGEILALQPVIPLNLEVVRRTLKQVVGLQLEIEIARRKHHQN